MKKLVLRSPLHRAIAVTALVASCSALHAQPAGLGEIAGRITDSSTGRALPAANLRLDGTNIGDVSDDKGLFRLRRIQPGTYSLITTFIGTAPDTTSVQVRAGETTELDIRLRRTVLALEGMTVEGQREGQARALSRQQAADNIRNIVAADFIGRFPDPNVAEALQRVPGISVFRDHGEGRFILIRGLEPRLTAVSIDGVETPAPDGEVRVVALDMIPSDQFAYVEVDKALVPAMDADGIGGAVNLVTKPAPNSASSKVTIGLGRNQLVSDGIREGSFSWGDRLGSKDELGVQIGGSFFSTDRGTDGNRIVWQPVVIDGVPVIALARLDLLDYIIRRRRMSLSGNLDYQRGEDSSLFLRAIYSRFTDHEFRRRLRYEFAGGTPISATAVSGVGRVERHLKDRYEAQDIYSFLLGGEHPIADDMRLSFRLGYAFAAEKEPDRRDSGFEIVGAGLTYDILDTDYPLVTAEDGAGIFDPDAFVLDELVYEDNETTDKALIARLDLSKPHGVGGVRGELQGGVKFRLKSKDRVNDVRIYDWQGDDDLTLRQVVGDFEDEDFLDDRYRLGRAPDPNAVERLFDTERDRLFAEDVKGSRQATDPSNYDASEDIYAAYLQAKGDVGPWRLLAGGRYELTDLTFDSNEVVLDEDGSYKETNAIKGSNDYGRFFPMLHLRYQVDEQTNLRAAWTSSLARPDYYSLAPYSIVEREDGKIERGNPALAATTASNFDLLAERYLTTVGVVSIGLFYKSLDDYIYIREFDEPAGPFEGYEVTQPINGGGAKLRGLELTWQQQLTFLPGVLNGLGVYTNYTVTRSEAELSDRADEIRLPGQAETVTNAAIGYQKHGLSGRLALNYHSEALRTVGEDALRDLWVDERLQLDLSLNYRVQPTIRLFAEFANLTDEPFRVYVGRRDLPVLQEFYSWWWNVGIKLDM